MACIKRQSSQPAFVIVLADAESNPSPNSRGILEKCWLAYHGYASWITRTSRKVCSGLHLTDMPSPEEITSQAKTLCQDYVYAKLKKRGVIIDTKVVEVKGKQGRDYSDVSREIQFLGGELEKMFPDLYSSMTKQLNVKLKSENSMKKTFLAVSDQLFKYGKISWGRIIALFAIANAFSSDCIQQGHPEWVSSIIDCFSQATSKHTAGWICLQGGWVDVLRAFRTSKEAPVVWTLSLIGAVVGFVMTLVATLQM